MIDSLLSLLGRFHPLIIHLPIGFIAMGLLIDINKKKFKWSNEALKFIFFWAAISGIFSIISGYFQYEKGGYTWETIDGHFYAGVSTVLLSFCFYLYLSGVSFFISLPRKLYSLGHIILLTITGHLGGNITHGEDHLTEPIYDLVGISNVEIKEIMNYEDFSDKSVYENLIQPIINDKCVKCHNTKKTKGGLQMHNFEVLKKGGRNGQILDFENPELSKILVRIHLPKSEKKHMPPSGGKQLSREEIKIIGNWITQGSSPVQSIAELKLDDNLKSYFFVTKTSFFPDLEILPVDFEKIKELKSQKIFVSPINKSSNFLSVSTINKRDFNDKDIDKLLEIKDNIVTIDFSKSSITDSIFLRLSEFPNLTVLRLTDTKVRGEGIEKLSVLENLKRINLVNTEFDAEFLEFLTQFKSLEKVYLFQENRNLITDVIPDNMIDLFDFGDYNLKDLPSDNEVYN
jgi:uncharacterized membrane protein|tara:strand:+ start:13661 stop:15034 length:1374 start_codon:yes stop_codon:yes gene_type:complete